MDFVDFFTLSGMLAWGYILWRLVGVVRGLRQRLRWAFWGHRGRAHAGRLR